MRKITIKEVKKWVNSFPINDWSKKPTQLEMRRITYFCNHGTNSRLPENISSKNDLMYSREKTLAEKYLKYQGLTESIRRIIREVIREGK